MAAIKALQQWCKVQCDGYRDVHIINMTSSFRDGLAFCALIHKFRPDLINFESLSKDNVYDNNSLAFCVAEDHLGIPALLEAEDMVALPVPDRLSILTYVSQYYNYFTGRSPSVGGVKRPAEDSKEEPLEKKNVPVTAKPHSTKTHPLLSSVSAKVTPNRLPSHIIPNSSSNKHVSTFPTQPRDLENHSISKNVKMVPPSTDSASTSKTAGMNTEQTVLVESSNKTGTLNSKCAVCRSHVHLVQRHLVDGKLYHRSCFRCCECLAVLQPGTYTSGQQPGTLRCSSSRCSQNSIKSLAKHRVSDATGHEPECRSDPSPRQHCSVLTSPVKPVPRVVQTTPAPEPWTPSALRTQAARKRFFLSDSEAPTFQNIIVPNGEEEKERTPTLISPELTEKNCNNNNKAYSRGLSPDNRSVQVLSPQRELHSSGTEAGDLCSLSSTDSMWLSGINKEHTRPHSSSLFIARAKDVGSCGGPKLKTTSDEPGLNFSSRTYTMDDDVTQQNKIVCNDTQPSQQHTRSVPGFQTTSITTRADLYTYESPSCSPAVSAEKGSVPYESSSQPETMSLPIKSHHIQIERITDELQEIENSLSDLEKEGLDLERRLRSCEEEGTGDILADPLMVEWFKLIQKKQSYIRRESELMYTAKTQDLEEQQPGVEAELRRLIIKPEHQKSTSEKNRESDLMKRLVEIVNDRNAIVDGLEEDRRREEEEDLQLNEMLQRLGVRKLKSRRKSSFSKVFRR